MRDFQEKKCNENVKHNNKNSSLQIKIICSLLCSCFFVEKIMHSVRIIQIILIQRNISGGFTSNFNLASIKIHILKLLADINFFIDKMLNFPLKHLFINQYLNENAISH